MQEDFAAISIDRREHSETTRAVIPPLDHRLHTLLHTLRDSPSRALLVSVAAAPEVSLRVQSVKICEKGNTAGQATERDEPKVHKIPHVRATVPLTITGDGVLVVRLSVEEDDPNGQRGKDYAYDEEPAPRKGVSRLCSGVARPSSSRRCTRRCDFSPSSTSRV